MVPITTHDTCTHTLTHTHTHEARTHTVEAQSIRFSYSLVQAHSGQADIFDSIAIVSELELVQLGHIRTATALERGRLVDGGLWGAARGEAGQVEDPAPPGGIKRLH